MNEMKQNKRNKNQIMNNITFYLTIFNITAIIIMFIFGRG